MITLSREEAQQVLDALEAMSKDVSDVTLPERLAIETIRARLSAPESVPIPTNANQAELMTKLGYNWLFHNAPDRLVNPLYAAPLQREWQGLTDEEKRECFQTMYDAQASWPVYADAIEAKLRGKNFKL